ncbi:ion channel protein [Streptomyces sp. NPDC006283]|uniref:ion channel protein n=1 Tax=Streptomyces sp. NPDC006283 TaxID=3156741 RepID=UPI0033BD32F5
MTREAADSPSAAGSRPSRIVPPQARALLPLVLPALLIGVGSSLVLSGISWVAERLEHWLWGTLPNGLGVSGTSAGWTLAMLTAAGLAAGLIVWKFPGHTGPDPATRGLVDPPLPVGILPGVLLAAVVTLAGGVSLGPENPITSINVALAYALGMKFMPRAPGNAWVSLAVAGTVGALFGTPVAAALILSEASGGPDPRPLWDRLFAPVFAAGAGSLTTVLTATPALTVHSTPYPGPRLIDAVSAMVIASAAAVVALAAVYVFPHVHRGFHRLGHPVLMLTAGGLVLGALGVLGGQLTLFKGLDQMRELTADPGAHSAGNLLLLALVKLAALVVAACCGFQGGRIFPAVFIGVALGMFAHALVTAVPMPVAIAAAVLGVLLATTRQGWLSLFVAAVLAADVHLLPLLCVAALPAWFVVTGRPEMLIKSPPPGSALSGEASRRSVD